jgi:two-component system KDP operon response regulator KdpE
MRMGLRVLLVEDDRALRRTLIEALELEGYAVHSAASLSEGLALLAHGGDTDLVLLDLGLPDGDGRRRCWRRCAVTAALPVIVISARAGRRPTPWRCWTPVPTTTWSSPLPWASCWRACAWRCATAAPRCAGGDALYARRRLSGRPGHAACHARRPGGAPDAHRIQAAGAAGAPGRPGGDAPQLLADVWGAEFVDHTHYLRLYMGQLRAKLEPTPPSRAAADRARRRLPAGSPTRLMAGHMRS